MKKLLWLLWLALLTSAVQAQKRPAIAPCGDEISPTMPVDADIFNLHYKKNEEYYIRFNKDGQLIGTMPSILRKGDKLCFAIEGKDLTLSPLQKKIEAYKTGLDTTKWDDLSIEAKLLFPNSDQFDTYKKEANDYFPKIDTIGINSIYMLTVYWTGEDNCPKSKTLPFDMTKAPCDLTAAISHGFDIPCDLATDELTYTLVRQNIDNLLVSRHLEANKKLYGQWGRFNGNIEQDKAAFTKTAKIITDSLRAYDYRLLMQLQPDSLPSDTLFKLLADSTSRKLVEKYIQKALLGVPQNQEWMKKWLWLTGLNAPAMNPFEKIKVEASSLIQTDKELAAAQRRTEALMLIIKNSQIACCNDQTNEASIKKYLDELETLQKQVVDLTDKKNSMAQKKDAYDKWLKVIQTSSNILYAGRFFVSNAEQINWMPHYNAVDSYRLSNAPNSIPEIVADIDVVRPMVFNLKRGEKAFSEETVKGFELTTPLTDAFKVWGGVFDGVLGITKNLKFETLNPLLSSIGMQKVNIENQQIQIEADFEKTKHRIEASNNGDKFFNIMGANNLPEQEKTVITPLTAKLLQLDIEKPIEARKILNEMTIQTNKTKNKTMFRLDGQSSSSFISIKNELEAQINAYEKLQADMQKIEEKKKKIEDFIANRQASEVATRRLKWLEAQTLPTLNIDPKPNTDTLYHTDWAEAKELKQKKGAVAVGYDLFVNNGKATTKVVKEASYKQYDLPRFWYGVGLAYVPQPRIYIDV
ncbi:MAG: hypothetical protein R2822_05200 [Spirosomataceae bacterium]